MIEVRETFSTTLILEDIIIPNQWDIHITLIPDGKHNKLYNKAMERLQYYIAEILDNSIFVGSQNISYLADLNFKAQVHIFPDDPWDHLISMCLYTKLNSILEGVFHVDNVTISSTQSRGISHSHNSDAGDSSLLEIFDADDESEIVKYWYNPHPELFLLHEGLKRVQSSWTDVDLQYADKNTDNIVNIKDLRKKPPTNDDNA